MVAHYYSFRIETNYPLGCLQSSILLHHYHIDFHSLIYKLFLLLYLLPLMKNLFLLILWNNGLILFHFQMLFHAYYLRKSIAERQKKESSHQHKCCLSWSSEDESLAANTELTTFDWYYTVYGRKSQTILTAKESLQTVTENNKSARRSCPKARRTR